MNIPQKFIKNNYESKRAKEITGCIARKRKVHRGLEGGKTLSSYFVCQVQEPQGVGEQYFWDLGPLSRTIFWWCWWARAEEEILERSCRAEGLCVVCVCAAAASFVIVPQGAVHSFCKCRECGLNPSARFTFICRPACSNIALSTGKQGRANAMAAAAFCGYCFVCMAPSASAKLDLRKIFAYSSGRHRQHFAGNPSPPYPTHSPCARLHNWGVICGLWTRAFHLV